MFLPPTPERYNPEDDLTVPGSFWCRCTGVRHGQPSRAFPDKANIVIEFAVDDPRAPKLKGKRVSIVTLETIYLDRQTGKASHLLTHLRNMGFVDPHKGADPEQAIGKVYYCRCEAYGDRVFVRSAVPQGIVGGKPVANIAPTERGDTPPINGADAPY